MDSMSWGISSMFLYVAKIKIQTIAFIEFSIIVQPNGVRFV